MAVTVVMVPVIFGLSSARALGGSYSSEAMGAGSASVISCDSASTWGFSFGKDADGRVSSIRLANIAPECFGGLIQVTLVGPSGISGATQTAITDCSVRCLVDTVFDGPRLYPSQIASVDALIVGP